ncbi:MAG TPA: VOC family protein [Dehalococcoidia bacterium]|nr:VOC family protein [Dehalococcoidia bacterium]
MAECPIEAISAVTLATHDMARSVGFYETIGFRMQYGGPNASFTSFIAGAGYLNLILQPKDRSWCWWGRAIFAVSDVDGLYEHVLSRGLSPLAPPRDAEWGERFFHLLDPDGHELSFMRPLEPRTSAPTA